MSLLGLDIGTTGCKAVAFDVEGNILAESYEEYPLLYPNPGWVEADGNLLWKKVKDALKKIAAGTKHDPIRALSISAQGEAVVPISKKGEVLYNFVITSDTRALSQYKWWQKKISKKEIFRITGMPLHPMYTINKIIWFKENMPDVYRKAWKFLCVEDFIIYRLGLKPIIDYSLASRTMAFDIKKKQWSEELLSLCDVDPNLFPQVRSSGQVVEKVSESIKEEVGLNRDVLVVTGGHDQSCGALGAGIISPGTGMNTMGTTDILCFTLPHLMLNAIMMNSGYPCYPHVYKDMYLTIALNLSGGLLMRWYRDNLCAEEKKEAQKTGINAYEIIIKGATDKIVDLYVLPHFVGSGTPTLDAMSKGTILGLTIGTTKADISKALLDSGSYEMKLNLDQLEKIGIKINKIRAVGGGAKSKRWLQLRADVFGKEIATLKINEASCLGAAILAGIAISEFNSAKEAIQQVVKIKEIFYPDMKKHGCYQEKYKRFIQIYPILKEFYKKA